MHNSFATRFLPGCETPRYLDTTCIASPQPLNRISPSAHVLRLPPRVPRKFSQDAALRRPPLLALSLFSGSEYPHRHNSDLRSGRARALPRIMHISIKYQQKSRYSITPCRGSLEDRGACRELRARSPHHFSSLGPLRTSAIGSGKACLVRARRATGQCATWKTWE